MRRKQDNTPAARERWKKAARARRARLDPNIIEEESPQLLEKFDEEIRDGRFAEKRNKARRP